MKLYSLIAGAEEQVAACHPNDDTLYGEDRQGRGYWLDPAPEAEAKVRAWDAIEEWFELFYGSNAEALATSADLEMALGHDAIASLFAIIAKIKNREALAEAERGQDEAD